MGKKGVKFGRINLRKITKITQIKVESMQTYEVNAFLRSCKDCLMFK